MAQILISLVLAGLSAVCIYSAHISGKVRNAQGVWLFYAFSLFFAVPLLVIVIKALGNSNPGFKKLFDNLAGGQEEKRRFTPHWFMALLIPVFVIILAVNIIKIVLGFIKS